MRRGGVSTILVSRRRIERLVSGLGVGEPSFSPPVANHRVKRVRHGRLS
jgi:hypothetical protein